MAGRRAGASMPHPQDTWLFAHCQSQLLALCPGFQVYKPLQSQLWVPAGEGSGSFLLRDQRHRQGYRDLLSSSRVGIGVGETRYSQHSSATKDCAYSHFPEGKGSQPRTQRQGGNRQGRNLTQAFSGSSRGLLGQSEEEGGGKEVGATTEVGEALSRCWPAPWPSPELGAAGYLLSSLSADRAGLQSMQGPGTETKHHVHHGPFPRWGCQTASSSPGACPAQDSVSENQTNIPISPS